jgi:DMSO/TMAO reductase YedYZ molybdopterin-dependent catalytic subunit
MGKSVRPQPEPGLITRRYFLKLGVLSAAAGNLGPICTRAATISPAGTSQAKNLEYLTCEEDFVNVGRGKPPPHDLSEEKLREVGLSPESWQLEVVPDPASNAHVEHPLSKASGSALTWKQFMSLAETKAVHYLHLISCTNMPQPLGMGLWEGVPLREVIWLTQPRTNIRRVNYYGYHNDDPKQRFQSSLPVGRVLEDPLGELPVILCYKLNGQWLTPKRGGPVRMIVPGVYGNKSVKWIQRVVLTNDPRQNDTYADWNNDTDSFLKTCACFRSVPEKVRPGQPVPVLGVAQVGMSGLSKVQYWVTPQEADLPAGDPNFANADWRDAEILPAPVHWGGGLPDGKCPATTLHFDPQTGQPREWPMRDAIAFWRVRLSNLAAGQYDLRCRSVDANGVAQPMPRPFPKSGQNAIQKVCLTVEA